MRRFVCGAVAIAALMAVSSAQACGTSCLRHRVSTLSGEVRSLEARVSSLSSRLGGDEATLSSVNGFVGTFNRCAKEVPLTQYGDPAGSFGYVWDDGTGSFFDTTAVDVTASGDPVGAWFITDTCNQSAAIRGASSSHTRIADAIRAFAHPF